MVNARSGWKLVTFDPEICLRTYLSCNFWIFDVEIRFENVYMPGQFQGHRARIKVTAAKNVRARSGLCSQFNFVFCVIKSAQFVRQLMTTHSAAQNGCRCVQYSMYNIVDANVTASRPRPRQKCL